MTIAVTTNDASEAPPKESHSFQLAANTFSYQYLLPGWAGHPIPTINTEWLTCILI